MTYVWLNANDNILSIIAMYTVKPVPNDNLIPDASCTKTQLKSHFNLLHGCKISTKCSTEIPVFKEHSFLPQGGLAEMSKLMCVCFP